MLIDYLNWTGAQWKEYAEKEMMITLEQLGVFLDACELLRDGKHLDGAAQQAWGNIVARFFPDYLDAILEIARNDSLLR